MSVFEQSINAEELSNTKTIHQLFELQAAKTPGQVAVVIENTGMTYAELNCRSNQLAHHLRKLHVGPNRLIGLFMNRSLEMVIGLLGILKAGGAFLPLDPTYLKEELATILVNAEPVLVLTKQHMLTTLPAGHIAPFCLDTQWPAVRECPIDNPPCTTAPENLACVIYRTGSEGKSENVCLDGFALMKLVLLITNVRHYQCDAKSGILPFSELFLALCSVNSLISLSRLK
jgi:non-ribosomal peptide synthetase component F